MNTNTEDRRAALAARLAANNAAGITGEIRINDDSTGVREQTFDPTEADHAPADHPLSGCTDTNGIPVPYSAVLKADPSSIIVTCNGLTMPLAQAYAMGLTTPEQVQGRAVTQPAPTATLPAQGADAATLADPEATEHEATVATLRAPLFDQQDQINLATLQDAAERSGFSLEVAARDLLVDGFNPEGATIQMLVNATGNTAEVLVETLAEINDHVVGQLVELAGEEVVQVAMQQPGWSQAALSSLSAGSLLPLAKFVAGLRRAKATMIAISLADCTTC